MLDRFDKVENKLDKLDERLDTIAIILEKNTASLEYHIKRTDLLEDSVDGLRQDLKPVERHVNYMNGAAKLVVVVSIVFGIIVSIIKIVEFF